jgi:hypothetical protein
VTVTQSIELKLKVNSSIILLIFPSEKAGLIYWKKNNAETQLLHLSSIYIRSRLNDRNGLERFFSGGWISPASEEGLGVRERKIRETLKI